jgi:hypothetical protein
VPAAPFAEHEVALIRSHLSGENRAHSWYADVALAAHLIEHHQRADRCLSILRRKIALPAIELGLQETRVIETLAERITEGS